MLPDLTIMGKIIGGGLPAAAYGGSRELMERIAPAGDVYQAGTLSGNPLAVAAALATLRAARRRAPTRSWRATTERSPTGCATRPRDAGRAGPGPERPGPADGVLLRRAGARLRRRRGLRPRRLRRAGAGRCWRAACTRRRRSSRPGSRRWPTTDERRRAHASRRPREAFAEVRGDENARDGALALAARCAQQGGTRRRRCSRDEIDRRRRARAPGPAADGRRRPAGGRARGRVRAAARDDPRGLAAALRRPAGGRAIDDPDLALLLGDQLYALGLSRLAALGDLEAVAELADLISLRRAGPGGVGDRRAGRGDLGGRARPRSAGARPPSTRRPRRWRGRAIRARAGGARAQAARAARRPRDARLFVDGTLRAAFNTA